MPIAFSHHTTHDLAAPALTLTDVGVRYGNTYALEDVSFTVNRGDQVAIVGPNGDYIDIASGPAMVLVVTGVFALVFLFAPERGLVWRVANDRQHAKA